MNGLNEQLVKLLQKLNMTIASAESCTGGLFSAYITEVSGSSEVFNETIVTYSNEAKMRELGVKAETLEAYGAVSRQTAKQMAEGIALRTMSDIGVGITGIAGPGGGTPTKPVGTVYTAVSIGGETNVYHLLINGNRSEVRMETCRFIMKNIIEKLQKMY